MSKFAVGNLVRVKDDEFRANWRDYLDLSENPSGWIGVVTRHTPSDTYPVLVKFISTGEEEAFAPNELEEQTDGYDAS